MRGKHFSLDEPIGNDRIYTKLERLWNQVRGPFSIVRHTGALYSANSCMTYSPSRYMFTPFVIGEERPTEEWLIEGIKKFIRDEFFHEDNSGNLGGAIHETTFFRTDFKKDYVDDSFLKDFLNGSDAFFRRKKPPKPNNETVASIGENIFALLTSSALCGTENKGNNDESDFIEKIKKHIKAKSRLMFIIPAFPFKDQNILRIPYEADEPDMGEISFLVRLHELSESINQIYPYGSDFVILSDGELYAEIFDVDIKLVKRYHDRLRYYRKLLNFQGHISIISLKDMIDNAGDTLLNLKVYIYDQVKKIIENTEDKDLTTKFSGLVKSMRANMNSRKTLSNSEVPFSVAKKIILGDESDLEFEYREKYIQFTEKAIEAAYSYIAVNLMLKFSGLEKKFFPNSFRATIHPKNGQFSLTTSAGGYPWNGVAYSEKWPRSVEEIKIIPFYELAQKEHVRQIIFATTGLPCCYTSSPKNPNVERARRIFQASKKSKGLFEEFQDERFAQLQGLRYRLLEYSDLHEFSELGEGDAEYTWENEIKDREYFSALLRFRINHYKNYGFGVYALLDDNEKMIGQFGLQVMGNLDNDEVEVVIYLSKPYRGKGIGTALFRAVRQKAGELRLNRLFATVRQEDERCKKVLSKACNGKNRIIRTQIYFHQIALVYSLGIQ